MWVLVMVWFLIFPLCPGRRYENDIILCHRLSVRQGGINFGHPKGGKLILEPVSI